MHRFIAFTLLWFLCSAAAAGQEVATGSTPNSTVHFYHDVGHIKWTLPNADDFMFGVPHFTVGPRVLCTRKIGVECEIEVSARQLWTSIEDRRRDLLNNVGAYLPDAVEQSPKIQKVGSPSVEYVVLTHKKDGGKIALGFAAHGPYVIRFRLVGRDPEGQKLSEVLAVIQSAEALNRNEFLAFKLADGKAACDKLSPESKSANDAAYANSAYSHVDYRSYFVNEAAPARGQAEVEANLAKVRQQYIEQIAEWPKESILSFCQSFPAQVENAEQ
ncbi:hypothetical protein [Methyloversatilis discipulorum]|uniref:hypothetical protein n=1 Tax=Methyloversatilis discipulorum TaxID=1119528 RepID=UPI0012F929E5|nr:hypothetical protein [Methyloversatilis discipulorum]